MSKNPQTTEEPEVAEMHIVELDPQSIAWIPGPRETHLPLMMAWITKNLGPKKGSLMKRGDPYRWVFGSEDDANKFKQAWVRLVDDASPFDADYQKILEEAGMIDDRVTA